MHSNKRKQFDEPDLLTTVTHRSPARIFDFPLFLLPHFANNEGNRASRMKFHTSKFRAYVENHRLFIDRVARAYIYVYNTRGKLGIL